MMATVWQVGGLIMSESSLVDGFRFGLGLVGASLCGLVLIVVFVAIVSGANAAWCSTMKRRRAARIRAIIEATNKGARHAAGDN